MHSTGLFVVRGPMIRVRARAHEGKVNALYNRACSSMRVHMCACVCVRDLTAHSRLYSQHYSHAHVQHARTRAGLARNHLLVRVHAVLFCAPVAPKEFRSRCVVRAPRRARAATCRFDSVFCMCVACVLLALCPTATFFSG